MQHSPSNSYASSMVLGVIKGQGLLAERSLQEIKLLRLDESSVFGHSNERESKSTVEIRFLKQLRDV